MKIESRIDLGLNVFCVQIDDGKQCRPYYFNVPSQPEGRTAQLFECCISEAQTRHEAWVSGNYEPEAAASTPTTVVENTAPAASPAVKKKAATAAEPTEEPATPPSAGPVKKKKPGAVAEAPKPVEVKFEKNPFCKKLFAEVMTEKLGAGWTKDADYAVDGKAIAKLLEDEGVVCAVDGVMTDGFKARIIEELESRYDFT